MNHNLPMNSANEILASVRQSLSDANMAIETGDAGWLIQGAFIRMRIFLEAAGLSEALKAVRQIEATAKGDWAATKPDPEFGGELYLVWGAKLYQYLLALETTLGEPKASVVTKDIIQILKATQYSITDEKCFPHPPASENDVHIRVEAVLRCVFPDLLHKPQITKQIKQFQPDTGLPSIGTLIEYKFMANHGEEKRMADEILADTRGYLSNEWKNYIYVIYETKRIKPENQWRQLLRESEVKANTEILVISGEEPKRTSRERTAPRRN